MFKNYLDSVRGELKEELKEEMKVDLKEEMKADLKEEIKADLKEEMKNDLKEEMREELKEEMREELKEEMRAEIQDMLVDYGINGRVTRQTKIKQEDLLLDFDMSNFLSKQMVAEKTSELERCLSELQDILIALEAAESRNAELTHAEIFSNSLQEALSQRDMILQKCSSDDSCDSLESLFSSEMVDDATSSHDGPLYELSELMAQLPIKRGLSKYYQGKSESFGSLANLNNIEDLAKKSHKSRRLTKSPLSPKSIITKNKKISSSYVARSSLYSTLGKMSSLLDIISVQNSF
ncbi:hypothetical protein Tco_1120011 [Tanacetum coccineum]